MLMTLGILLITILVEGLIFWAGVKLGFVSNRRLKRYNVRFKSIS